MSKQKFPPKWSDVYPQGTKVGDEEQRFFKSLVRSEDRTWRSTSHISKEANLDPKRVEEIALKYMKKGMVFQNPQNIDEWGYWELNKELLPEPETSISESDQTNRVDRVLGKRPSGLSAKKADELYGKKVQKTFF